MKLRRSLLNEPQPGDLAGGPGKLCQALDIDRALNGVALDSRQLSILPAEDAVAEIAIGSRIGIDYAGDAAHWPLRFAWRDNPHVSRPWPW